MFLQRGSCFFILCVLASGNLFCQTAGSGENIRYKDGASLDITGAAVVRSWTGTNDPLGKPVGYTDFNNRKLTDSTDIGLSWWEARDIERAELVLNASFSSTALQSQLPVIQYWQQSWPETPPRMPSKEDLEDDPWQGRWVTAVTETKIKGNIVSYTFKPMSTDENRGAANLPVPVMYRRTLKLRWVFAGKPLAIRSVKAFSVSKIKTTNIRIELLPDPENKIPVQGSLEVFNGKLKSITGWNLGQADKIAGAYGFRLTASTALKGLTVALFGAAQSLPGSNDETVVTFKSPSGTFSFSMDDVEKGPVYIPHFNAYITLASDLKHFSIKDIDKGKTTRQRIPDEPEQTYDRARNEIPHLDPTHRVSGGEIDLPLAPDASWQKFAVQWGGNIFMDKEQTKAQGKELLRCNWIGKDLRWKIGTGRIPDFKRTLENCRMSVLNDYLPVVQANWNQGGLNYHEEAFSVLLRGPLSPVDPGRDEQTPAMLMVKLVVANPGLRADTAVIWLAGNRALKGLSIENNFLMDELDNKKYIRCYIAPGANPTTTTLLTDSTGSKRELRQQIILAPNSSQAIYFYFPFVGDLTTVNQEEIAALNYEYQKNRVTSYWREVVSKNVIYNVPERKFNDMAKAVIPHIRMSVTKEPTSGLYMVPAAAFSYMVYPNEAIFQTLLLDRLGDFPMSANYLNTFMELQGSSKLPGTFTGGQADVFYGLKVDSVHDFTEGNGYNMHHGTVLWGLARHFLYSRDRDWLRKAAPHMIRAANWIIEQRQHTKETAAGGKKAVHYGLLPAGVLEDVHDWQYWYATNAYACLGMEAMAKAFEKAGLPEAVFYKNAAKSYHDDIRNSIEMASAAAPVIRLRNNTFVPYVPSQPHQRFRYFGTKKASYYDRYGKAIYPTLRLSAIRECLYGPVVLLKAGLIDANEPMADWVLDDWEDNLTLSSSLNLNVHGRVDDEYWFSRGGMVFQANLINPVSIYLARQEIPATIRGLYDNFVSCLYPDINAHTEEFREWGHGSGPFYKCPDEARFLSQVCDLLVVENKGEVWLAAGTPRRWLEPGQDIELKNAQTECGELSYALHAGNITGTIEAEIRLPQNNCSKILLFVRAPFSKPISKVAINGRDWKMWDAKKECVEIPQTEKNVQVVVYYE